MNNKEIFFKKSKYIFLNSPIPYKKSENKLNVKFPKELKELYSTTNGLSFGRFVVFPIYDTKNKKTIRKTWDSLERNNNPEHTNCCFGDKNVFDEFMVFASDGKDYYLFKNNNNYIWIWQNENNQIIELDYKLWDWLVEAYMKELKNGMIEEW